jgi:hypothetical protein
MAFVLTMGDVHRFQRGKQVASYPGLIPREVRADISASDRLAAARKLAIRHWYQARGGPLGFGFSKLVRQS